MSGIYDRTLASGAADNISATGSFLKITSAPNGAVQVKLDGGEAYSLMEGQGIRLPDGATFRDVAVKNLASNSQTVLVFIGDSRFEDTRITGTVSIIDGGKQRTLNGDAFLSACLATAVAAQNAHCQLWVPAGGANRLVVKTLHIASSTAGAIHLRVHNAAIATLYGSLSSKLLGTGALPTFEVRNANNAGLIGVVALGIAYVQAAQTLSMKLDEPIIIPPGQGLIIAHATVNTDLSLTFEGFREAVT
jgi:hypothetical protein